MVTNVLAMYKILLTMLHINSFSGESIDVALKALMDAKATTRAPLNTTEAVVKKTKVTEAATTTTAAAMTMTSTTPEASVLIDPLKSAAKIDGNSSSAEENVSLTHGSSGRHSNRLEKYSSFLVLHTKFFRPRMTM